MTSSTWTPESLVVWIDNLTVERQTRFLARIIVEVTISTRGHYSDLDQLVNSENGVGAINEFLHQISQLLLHTIETEDKVDSALFLRLMESSRIARCLSAIIYAVESKPS